MYRVTIDTDACEGIFACLVRDDRFVESEDGLAGLEAGTAETYRTDEGSVVAEFDDDRLDDARQAVAACPPGAITVEELDSVADRTTGEAGACR
jgi:ferredoxin